MNKIQTLNTIIKEYSKYFTYFDDANVFDLGLRFAIKFYSKKNNTYNFLIRKFPKYDIDKIIKRYRSKLYYEKEKQLEQNINKSILELDFLYKLRMFG